MLQSRQGTLYGTTKLGGAQGAGAVFSIEADGSSYAILRSLDASVTNSLSFQRGLGELAQVSAGTLYGILYEGGATNVYGGLLFQLAIDGSAYDTVHGFGTNAGDGLHPAGRIVAPWSGPTAGWFSPTTVLRPG